MTLAKMALNNDLSDLQKSRRNQCLVFSIAGDEYRYVQAGSINMFRKQSFDRINARKINNGVCKYPPPGPTKN